MHTPEVQNIAWLNYTNTVTALPLCTSQHRWLVCIPRLFKGACSYRPDRKGRGLLSRGIKSQRSGMLLVCLSNSFGSWVWRAALTYSSQLESRNSIPEAPCLSPLCSPLLITSGVPQCNTRQCNIKGPDFSPEEFS